jgi:hypothetical protein
MMLALQQQVLCMQMKDRVPCFNEQRFTRCGFIKRINYEATQTLG